MTLNQLEYFCAVCRYHSITRAANELYVSQPTISVAIRNLENEFHIRLFNHGKNQLALTPEGEAFYKKADHLLHYSQDLYSEFSLTARGNESIRLGIPPILSTVFFPEIMLAFQEKTHIPLQLFEYGSVRACKMVESEELDLAIANLDFYNVDKFHYQVMKTDSHVYCVSKTNPLAKKDSITFEMLADQPSILFNTDSVQNRTIMSRFHAAEITPNIIMYSSQISTARKYILEDIAGAFFYSSVPLSCDDIIKIPIEPEITSRIGIIWKKGVYVRDSVTRFIEFAKTYQL